MPEHSTPRIDVPEAYQARMNLGYGGIENGDEFLQKSMSYTENQQKQLGLEAELLGINPTASPDRFVEAHNALLGDLRAERRTTSWYKTDRDRKDCGLFWR